METTNSEFKGFQLNKDTDGELQRNLRGLETIPREPGKLDLKSQLLRSLKSHLKAPTLTER